MSTYVVKYGISTLDDDGPTTETEEFEASDDRSAKYMAKNIVSKRREHINKRGGLCNAWVEEVYKVSRSLEKI